MRDAERRRPDYREFVFTATGKATDLSNLTLIDVYDNLTLEADRLKALAELLGGFEDEMPNEVARYSGLLVKDIERRIRTILELSAVVNRPRRKRSTSR